MQRTTERRQEILYFISDRRHTTCQQIADEFHISRKTAQRDVEILMCSYPIITENHRYGGIRAMDGWYASRRYLTDKQEYLLRQLLSGLQPDDQKTMEGILAAFAKPQIKEDKQ
jgi:predicted DNA-binding transcriptional regulator YafY